METRDKIRELVERLESLTAGDERIAFILQHLEDLNALKRYASWAEVVLAHYALKDFNECSLDFKLGYVNRQDFIRKHFRHQLDLLRRLSKLLFRDMHLIPKWVDVFKSWPSHLRLVAGMIRSGRMTEELWVALMDPSMSVPRLERLLSEVRGKEKAQTTE